MPNWQSFPAGPTGPYAFRILRTPATTPIDAICTCTSICGCPTHFAANRTIPCEGQPGCKLCEEGHSWRWHGYLSAILVKGLEHCLFEFTAQAAETFRTYQLTQNALRGCHFLARRPSGRPNGRVVIAAKPEDLNRIRLPEPPNIRLILCHIWGIPYNQPEDTTHDRLPFERIKIRPGNGQDARYSGSPKEPA